MIPRKWPNSVVFGFIGLLFLSEGPRGQEGKWNPPVRNVTHLFVRAELLAVRDGRMDRIASTTMDAAPGRPGLANFPLSFGGPGSETVSAVEVQIEGSPSDRSTLRLSVVTTATVTGLAGITNRLRRERTTEVAEGGSFLHQVYENAALERSLVLTLTPELRDIPEMITPTAGTPVTFHVSLARLTPGGPVSLEDNLLRTLVGSSVSYSFRLASAGPSSASATSKNPPAPAANSASEGTTSNGSHGDPAASGDGAAGTQGAATKGASTSRQDASSPSQGDSVSSGVAPAGTESASATPEEPDSEASSSKAPETKKIKKPRGKKRVLLQTAKQDSSGPISPTAESGAAVAPAAEGVPAGSPDHDSSSASASEAVGRVGEAAAASGRSGMSSEESGPNRPISPPLEAAPQPSSPIADELEITLLPRRADEGVLVVDVSVKGRTREESERDLLVQRTQALTRGGSFEITVDTSGAKRSAPYRFTVAAQF